MEFRQHKRDYYCHKLGYTNVTQEVSLGLLLLLLALFLLLLLQVLKEQAECYVRAIQWNLHYYYNGCVSWSW